LQALIYNLSTLHDIVNRPCCPGSGPRNSCKPARHTGGAVEVLQILFLETWCTPRNSASRIVEKPGKPFRGPAFASGDQPGTIPGLPLTSAR